MKNLGYDLINSNVSDNDIQSFKTFQKQDSKKIEIEVLEGSLESIVKNIKDNNNSENILKTELDKLGKIISLFSDEGFQYAVEHTISYLAQEITAFSYKKAEDQYREINNHFDRSLLVDYREIIAQSFIKDNSNRQTELLLIVTDYYKSLATDYFKNFIPGKSADILNNVNSFYSLKELYLDNSSKNKIK